MNVFGNVVWGFSVLGIELRSLTNYRIRITPDIDWVWATWHFEWLDEPMK
jgi:hypothetical protein